MIHLFPPSCPHSVLENVPLLSYCSLDLLSIAKPKHPKGEDAFLRDSRTCWAGGRRGDLVSLVFNHHCLNPLLLTHSLIFAKSLVTGTAHLFSKGCCENDICAKHRRWVTKNETLCLRRAFSVEALVGVKIALIVSVGVW